MFLILPFFIHVNFCTKINATSSISNRYQIHSTSKEKRKTVSKWSAKLIQISQRRLFASPGVSPASFSTSNPQFRRLFVRFPASSHLLRAKTSIALCRPRRRKLREGSGGGDDGREVDTAEGRCRGVWGRRGRRARRGIVRMRASKLDFLDGETAVSCRSWFHVISDLGEQLGLWHYRTKQNNILDNLKTWLCLRLI